MPNYPFNMQLAVSSIDENVVMRDGSLSIYDPEDTGGTTLLTLTTPGGVPLPNPLATNEYGLVQPFIATLPQVMWRSGEFEGYFESYKGLRDEAIGARDAAAASALAAHENANGLTVGTVESGEAPAVTLTGEAPDRVINFVLQQGETGPQGPAGSAGPLDGLTDVTAPSPTDGQALIWDSGTSRWVNETLPTPASALDDLTDVTAPSPTDGQALLWDAATSTWKNVTLAGGHAIGADLIQTASYNPTVTAHLTGTQPALKVYVPDTASRTAPILWVGTNGSQNGNPVGIRVEKDGTGSLLELGNTAGTSITHFRVNNNGLITRMDNKDNFIFGPRDTSPEGSVVAQYGLMIDEGGGWAEGDRPGRLWHKAWHHSYNDGWAAVGSNTDFQTKTANYTMAVMDELIIGNGTNITITVPAPNQIIMGGRLYRIKNVNSTPLTVVSAGTSKTIDGAASVVLQQWDKITVMSDGTQWLIVEGRRQVTVSATAPTAPVNGDVWFDIS